MVSCLVKTASGETRFGAKLQPEDKTNALVQGLYSGRGYKVGDQIYLDRQTIVITEFFTGWDYQGRELEMFAYSSVCTHCGEMYKDTAERKEKHEGYYGMICKKKEAK